MRLAVCSSKGGVGKTSTAANLAAVLGSRARAVAGGCWRSTPTPRTAWAAPSAWSPRAARTRWPDCSRTPRPTPAPRCGREVAPGVDLLPAHTSLEAVGVALAAQGGLLTGIRRVLRPLLADYDHVVLDTHGDLGNLTLSAVAAADAVLTVFTSDPGSALGAARVSRLRRAAPPLREHLAPSWSASPARCGTARAAPPARSSARSRAPACRCSRPASRSPGGCRARRSPSAPSSCPRRPAPWRWPTPPSPTRCWRPTPRGSLREQRPAGRPDRRPAQRPEPSRSPALRRRRPRRCRPLPCPAPRR